MSKMTLAAHIIRTREALSRCKLNLQDLKIWEDKLEKAELLLPSGGGIDRGCRVNTLPTVQLVIECAYHHMGTHGYTYWSVSTFGFVPTWEGLDVSIYKSGADSSTLEYLSDVLVEALETVYTWDGKEFVKG